MLVRHFPRVRTVLLALCVPLMAMLAFAASGNTAFAASNAGTQHINQTQCTPDTYTGGQDCLTADALINDTITPSGNESFVEQGTMTLVITDASGNVLYSETETVNWHYLGTPGGMQEEGATFTNVQSDGVTTCSYTEQYHYANGTFQFDRFSSTC